MIVVAFLQEGEVWRLGEVGLVVQQVEDSNWLPAQHVDYGLDSGRSENGAATQ